MGSTCILYIVFSLLFSTVLAESISNEARLHKLPFEILLFHSFGGIGVVLVIIKIVLAMGFIGMLTALFHAFAGIKHLLKTKEYDHDFHDFHGLDHFSPYDHFHDFHFDEAPPFYKTQAPEEPSYPIALRKTQSLEGGRSTRNPTYPYIERLASHSVDKRQANQGGSSNKLKRIMRSTNDNCKKGALCKLHAKAQRNPMYAFELYFIRKKGLAKYWDHKEHTYVECEKIYPCYKYYHSPQSSISNTDKSVQKVQYEYDDDDNDIHYNQYSTY